jgi:hypothetical protein
MVRLSIVYHEVASSAYRRFFRALGRLVKGVAELAGSRVRAIPLTMLGSIQEGEYVFALLLTRGGHYMDVLRVCESRSAYFLGKVPDTYLVRLLAKATRVMLSGGCRCVWLDARATSRRPVSVELEVIAYRVSQATGAVVVASPLSHGCCRLVLSLTSRLPWGSLVVEELVPELTSYLAKALEQARQVESFS